MVLTRKAVTVAAVVTAAAALAACGSSPASTPPAAASVAAAPVAANPVPLLATTGATPEPGEVLGSTDIEGDRYASGSYPDGEQVTVYTFATAAAQAADLARNGTPTDTHAVIRARLANVYVTPVGALAGGYIFSVTPAQIAGRIGGKVISP